MFKDILNARKMTCYSLSKKSGISYTAINELYRGERNIGACSVDMLIKLSNALNMDYGKVISICKKRNKIPSEFKKYFWDTLFNELDLLTNQNYIISRLLTKGGYDGFRFVFSSYTYEEIKQTALTSRALDKYVAAYLFNLFKLNKNDMAYYRFASKEWER